MNIAEILKNKPQGTKLYTPIWGYVTFDHIGDDETIYVLFNTYDECVFYNDGKYSTEGECMLFPSKEMRDWSKFSWKRGDVLKGKNENEFCIFNKFINDSYNSFYAKYLQFNSVDGPTITPGMEELVEDWYEKASPEEAREYIKEVEETFNGKFDMENLEIVPNKPTEPKFEPYEKVVARYNRDAWRPEIFGYADGKSYYCIGGWYSEILPYNKDTAKLIGTFNDYKED